MPHADKWGPAGSVFAALCCLGVAPLLAVLSAVGLGFLIHDWVLIPLLAFFLGITVWAFHRDRPRHGHYGPERLGWVGGILTFGGVWGSGFVVGVGLMLLVGASAWNGSLVHRGRSEGGIQSGAA